MAGVRDPCMRKFISHNLHYPNEHLHTFTKNEVCGDDYKEYFYIVLATTILLLLLIAFLFLLLYHKIRLVIIHHLCFGDKDFKASFKWFREVFKKNMEFFIKDPTCPSPLDLVKNKIKTKTDLNTQ